MVVGNESPTEVMGPSTGRGDVRFGRNPWCIVTSTRQPVHRLKRTTLDMDPGHRQWPVTDDPGG